MTYLVGIFRVNVVLDGVDACLVEVLGTDLDEIRNLCLEIAVSNTRMSDLGSGRSQTRINMVCMRFRS